MPSNVIQNFLNSKIFFNEFLEWIDLWFNRFSFKRQWIWLESEWIVWRRRYWCVRAVTIWYHVWLMTICQRIVGIRVHSIHIRDSMYSNGWSTCLVLTCRWTASHHIWWRIGTVVGKGLPCFDKQVIKILYTSLD